MGIIGYVPSGAFEVKTALGNEFLKFSGALFTFGKGLVGKFLYYLLNIVTFGAFIFIDWHIYATSGKR